ncbi:hypothetical protein [Rubripirellula obstinata]|uniref:hypothetical protein n=1 Tax=Rubripirellula obstinata TaxID=406547 RepID=UPI00082CB613|nr:hypothetical protein [Rubripirellula obstinata]
MLAEYNVTAVILICFVFVAIAAAIVAYTLWIARKGQFDVVGHTYYPETDPLGYYGRLAGNYFAAAIFLYLAFLVGNAPRPDSDTPNGKSDPPTEALKRDADIDTLPSDGG